MPTAEKKAEVKKIKKEKKLPLGHGVRRGKKFLSWRGYGSR